MPRNPEMDERYTPAEVFKPLDRLFSFDLDPCATTYNSLAMRYFFTKEDDGLQKSWAGRKAFVNPPYSAMQRWAAKAVYEAMNGAFVAFILPNDCSTGAWQLLAEAAWGRWEIPFRVKFGTPSGRRVDVARSHVVFFLGELP